MNNKIIFFIILIIFCKKEKCNNKILNKYKLSGYNYYNINNNNYVCPEIKKNCCTLNDQKIVIESINQSIIKNNETNEKAINSWELLIQTLNEFFLFEYYDYLKEESLEKVKNIYTEVLKLKELIEVKTEIFYNFEINSIKLQEIEDIIDKNYDKFNNKFNSMSLIKANFWDEFMKLWEKNQNYIVGKYNDYLKNKNKLNIYENLEKDFEFIINSKEITKETKNKEYYISKINKYLKLIYLNNQTIIDLTNFKNNYKIVNNSMFSFKKSIYCILCDFDSFNYINKDENEIQIEKSFCRKIIKLYKDKIIYKLNYLYPLIKNLKEIISTFGSFESNIVMWIDHYINLSKKLLIELNVYPISKLNKKNNDENFDEMIYYSRICEYYKLNKFEYIFDDIDPIFEYFTNFWIGFKEFFNKLKKNANIKLTKDRDLKQIKDRDLKQIKDRDLKQIKERDLKQVKERNLKLNITNEKNDLSKQKIDFKNKLYNSINISDFKNIKKIKKIKNSPERSLFLNNHNNSRYLSNINNILFKYKDKLDKFEPIVFWLDKNYSKLEGKEMKYLKFINNYKEFYNKKLTNNISNKYCNSNKLKEQIKNLKIDRIPDIFKLYNNEMSKFDNKVETKIEMLYDYFKFSGINNFDEIKKKIIDILVFNNKIKFDKKVEYKLKKNLNIGLNYDRINISDPFKNKNLVDFENKLYLKDGYDINIFNYTLKFNNNGINIINIASSMKDNSITLKKIKKMINLSNNEYYINEEISDSIKNINQEFLKYNYIENFNNNYMINYNIKYLEPQMFIESNEKVKEFEVPEFSKIILKEDYYYFLTNEKIKDIFVININREWEYEKNKYYNKIEKFFNN